jgi:hypothetical protein
MSMFDCPHCHDRHHINDFCATGPMSMAFTVRSYSMPRTAVETGSVGTEAEGRSAPIPPVKTGEG